MKRLEITLPVPVMHYAGPAMLRLTRQLSIDLAKLPGGGTLHTVWGDIFDAKGGKTKAITLVVRPRAGGDAISQAAELMATAGSTYLKQLPGKETAELAVVDERSTTVRATK